MKLDTVLKLALPFLATDKQPEDLRAAILAADASMPGNVASSKEIEDKRAKDRRARDEKRTEDRRARDARRAKDRKARDEKEDERRADDRAARDEARAQDKENDSEHAEDRRARDARRTEDRKARDARRAKDRRARDEKEDEERAEDRRARDARFAEERRARDARFGRDRDDDPEHTNDEEMRREAADEEREEEEAEDEDYAEGADPSTPGGSRAGGKTAIDSAEVDRRIAEAVSKAVASRNALHAAQQDVEPILGRVAFDSASATYRAALKALDVDLVGVPDAALPAMLKLAKDRASVGAPPIAMDSASTAALEKIIPGYGRLR